MSEKIDLNVKIGETEKPIGKSHKLLLIIPVGLIVLLLGYSVYYNHLKNVQKINPTLLSSLALEGTSKCNQGLQQVSGEKVDPHNINDSIALLSYRWTCFSVLGKYPEALANLQQLRSFYVTSQNFDRVTLIDSEIADIKYAISHPKKYPNQVISEATPQQRYGR
jgi:hypothetical protein